MRRTAEPGRPVTAVLRLILLPVVLIAATLAAAATRPPDYVKGEKAFNTGRYHDAHVVLRPFYRGGGRYREVAYWIGSSLCRDQLAPNGRKWLHHTLTDYRLAAEQARVVESERKRCTGQAASTPPPPLYATQRLTTELLYFGLSTQLIARPVTPAVDIPEAELAARRVRIGDGSAAAVADRLIERIEAARGATAPCGLDRRPAAQIAGRFLFVTRRTYQTPLLDGFATILERYLDRLRGDLGITPPGEYLTVHLAACDEDAMLTARALHGVSLDLSQVAGFSVRDDLSLVALWDGSAASGDSQAVRTLRHELFHLVAEEHFPDMPQWLNEGLAQYYGVIATHPEYGGTTVLPPQWGELPTLRAVLQAPWLRFDAIPEAGGEARCVAIAEAMMQADVARMFLAFVDRTPGQLRRLFKRLRETTPDDWGESDDRVAEIETLLGASVETLEQRYRAVSTIDRSERAAALFAAHGDDQRDDACLAARPDQAPTAERPPER